MRARGHMHKHPQTALDHMIAFMDLTPKPCARDHAVLSAAPPSPLPLPPPSVRSSSRFRTIVGTFELETVPRPAGVPERVHIDGGVGKGSPCRGAGQERNEWSLCGSRGRR